MLYIQKEGSTLTVRKDDQTVQLDTSLKQFLTQRTLDTEKRYGKTRAKLKTDYHTRYLKPWFVQPSECYVATQSMMSFNTTLINAMRVLSVEPSGLDTLIVFETGDYLKLPIATKPFKRRWLEATQFIKAQPDESYKRFHR